MTISPFFWQDKELHLLDQRFLPREEKMVIARDGEDCYLAIKDMVVRGAPLIGLVGLAGAYLWLKNRPSASLEEFINACSYLGQARPTAVNLTCQLNKCVELAKEHCLREKSLKNLGEKIFHFMKEEERKGEKDCREMASLGAREMERIYGKRPLQLMTLCNTGPLACGVPWGTALGVIFYLHQLNRIKMVYVSETRPYLQGCRLTAYELSKENIEHQVVVEGASSYLMRERMVDGIFVGADRIATNGDTANKIGTSALSIVAQHYQVPFFVVAPTDTFDQETESGDQINIELRSEEEVLSWQNTPIAPQKSKALNPSFDITPAHLITGIICQRGLIRPPYTTTIKEVLG